MKKIKVIIFISLLILILIIAFILYNKNKNKFDINNSISDYNLSDANIRNEYIEYLKSKMEPKNIINFIDNDEIILDFYNENANGNNIIMQMEQLGYKQLFNYLFNNDYYDLSKVCITEKFSEKYIEGLRKYFNFKEVSDNYNECVVDINNHTLVVNEMSEFVIGEPKYVKYHHFHYTLDESGNIDDIELSYKEE